MLLDPDGVVMRQLMKRQMCVFRLSLESAARDDRTAIDRRQERPEDSPL